MACPIAGSPERGLQWPFLAQPNEAQNSKDTTED